MMHTHFSTDKNYDKALNRSICNNNKYSGSKSLNYKMINKARKQQLMLKNNNEKRNYSSYSA